LGDGAAAAQKLNSGLLAALTDLDFQQGPSGKLHVLSNKIQQRSIFRPDFNFEDLGIGGLSKLLVPAESKHCFFFHHHGPVPNALIHFSVFFFQHSYVQSLTTLRSPILRLPLPHLFG
jgi:hypothetical protein